jgi:hypothetical protein
MDMNSLLSGLADSQKSGNNKSCNCNNNGGGCDNGGIGGGSGIWIIVLLLLFCSQGQQDNGTVCGCDPKHCKELCRCGSSTTGNGIFGLGGLGGGCGGGSGIWIIILILLLVCSGNGKNNKGCTNNIINLDGCDEE